MNNGGLLGRDWKWRSGDKRGKEKRKRERENRMNNR